MSIYRRLIVCSLLGVSSLAFAQEENAETCQLEVTITGAKSDKGHFLVSLYNSLATFMKDPEKLAVRHEKIEIHDGQAHLEWKGLPPGDYAVAVAHDANDNGKLDSNKLGIPIEGFGFSANPSIKMGPPPFAKARIQVEGPATSISIKIKN